MRFSRRWTLVGLASAGASIATRAGAGPPIDAAKEFGLDASAIEIDQSGPLQAAMNAASKRGRLLLLPAGRFNVGNLEIPDGLTMAGIRGQTILTSPGDVRLGHIAGAAGISVENIVFQASEPEMAAGVQGLIEIEASSGVTFRACGFNNNAGNGISASDSAFTVEDCDFHSPETAAIHSQNGKGVMIRGNRISECGNAGIRIWRDQPGPDNSIIAGNRIDGVDFKDGGNGQNGNGISIYKADNVVVSDNVISGCAFSAVRVNSGKNTQIHGNTCVRSGEVAIYSEFGFSGSVIANNVIDGASAGISITNLDKGGHLATCTGNVVRNIAATSATNPEATPYGIYAEADTVIANNAIDNVPGPAILVGYGPFVRNIIISDNVITGARYGVAVSVVQDAAVGPVRISGNLIGAGTEHAMIGMEWEKIVSTDLAADVARYPNIAIGDNTVG
jgi:uncharacterized secreted repeat protein (TIGR03808 family)